MTYKNTRKHGRTQWLLLILVLTLILPFGFQTMVFSEPEKNIYTEPEVFGEYALLIAEDNDQILYSKNADAKVYPASTTKILTGLIALETLDLNQQVTIGERPPHAGGSMIVMDVGEVFTVEQLLYGLMLPSGNDCAEALAIKISGSIENFAKRMNEKAAELGAVNTHFNNPHGMPDPDHYTTPADMYLIAKAAMKNEMFRKIVSTPTYQIPPTNKQPETRYLATTNLLFSGINGSERIIDVYGNHVTTAYPYVIGIKTGSTDEAGKCLVSAATYNGKTVYSMIFKSNVDHIYQDTVRLLEYGLKGFKKHTLYNSGDVVKKMTIKDSIQSEIRLITKEDIFLHIPIDMNVNTENKEENDRAIYTEILSDHAILPPINKTDSIAEFVLHTGFNQQLKTPLFSDVNVNNKPLINQDITVIKNKYKIPYWRIIVSTVALVVLYRIFYRLFKKRRS